MVNPSCRTCALEYNCAASGPHPCEHYFFSPRRQQHYRAKVEEARICGREISPTESSIQDALDSPCIIAAITYWNFSCCSLVPFYGVSILVEDWYKPNTHEERDITHWQSVMDSYGNVRRWLRQGNARRWAEKQGYSLMPTLRKMFED